MRIHHGLGLSVLNPRGSCSLQPPALVNSVVRHPDSSELKEQIAADKKQQMGFHGDGLVELQVSSFFLSIDGGAAGGTWVQEGKTQSWS